MMYLMLLKSVCCAFGCCTTMRIADGTRNTFEMPRVSISSSVVARIELGHDDVHRTGAQTPHAVADAADVKTRHRDEADVAVASSRSIPCRRSAAAAAGRRSRGVAAARLSDDPWCRWCTSEWPRRRATPSTPGSVRALLVAPLRKIGPLAWPRAHRNDPLHVFQIAFDLLDEPVEIRADAQHLGAAVVEDVRDFGRCEPPVDAHRYRARFRRTEHELIEQVRVLVEEADAAAGAQSFGQKPVRNLDSSVRRTDGTSSIDPRTGTRLCSAVRVHGSASVRQACGYR